MDMLKITVSHRMEMAQARPAAVALFGGGNMRSSTVDFLRRGHDDYGDDDSGVAAGKC